MTPELILATIKSVADAITEIAKYRQTPEGQKDIDQIITNREAIKTELTTLFSPLKGLIDKIKAQNAQ